MDTPGATSREIAKSPPMPFGWIGRTVRQVAGLGIDVAPDLQASRVGDPRAPLADDAAIGADECLLMGALVINGIDDEMHGLAATRMSRGTGNLMAQAAAAAPTLQGAIDTFATVFALAGSSCSLELTGEGGVSRLAIRARRRLARPRRRRGVMAIFLHGQLSAYLDFFLPLVAFGTSG